MTTPVPEDFHTITPHLAVTGVAAAIDWYTRAFGAHELLRNTAPDDTRVIHADQPQGDEPKVLQEGNTGSMGTSGSR
jgi:PhnB protein